MGWTFIHCEREAKTPDLIRDYFTQKPSGDNPSEWGIEYISMRGSVAYCVFWHASGAQSPRKYFGGVILTSRKNRGFCQIGFKDMTEDMGPYYYDAPQKMLDLLDALAPEPGYSALEWRAKCRANIASKKNRGFKNGDYVKTNLGEIYKLAGKLSPRRGYRAINAQGQAFRMPFAVLNRCEKTISFKG